VLCQPNEGAAPADEIGTPLLIAASAIIGLAALRTR
jgi:hypothetical protein